MSDLFYSSTDISGELWRTSQEVDCSGNVSTYHHYISRDNPPGRAIYNAGVTADEHSCDLAWHADNSITISGHVSMEVPHDLAIYAREVFLNSTTTANVQSLCIAAELSDDSTLSASEHVFVNNAGTKNAPMSASHIHSRNLSVSGESWMVTITASVEYVKISGSLNVERANYTSRLFTLTESGVIQAAFVTMDVAWTTQINGALTTPEAVFAGGDLMLCGVFAINLLTATNKGAIELCPTAQGSIGTFVAMSASKFKQNSNVTIGNLMVRADHAHILTQALPEVIKAGTKFNGCNITASDFEYKGNIYVVNNGTLALSIRGWNTFVIHDEFRAGDMSLNFARNVTNVGSIKAKTVALHLEAGSFKSEKFSSMHIDGMAKFSFSTPGAVLNFFTSDVKLGAINVQGAGKVLCKGSRLIVCGIEDSEITADSFIVTREFYEKGATTSCGRKPHKWICGHRDNPWYVRAVGGGSFENVYCHSQSSCTQEAHTFGKPGAVSISGHLNLTLNTMQVDASNVWMQSVQFIGRTITPKVSSHRIVKTVTVTGNTNRISVQAAEYGITGYNFAGNAISQVTEELSGRFLFNTSFGGVEQILLDWGGAVSASSNTLVPEGFFANREPANVDALMLVFAHRRATEDEFFARLMSSKNVLPEYKVMPLLMALNFVSMCNDGTLQDQLDCEQYEFLKALGLEFPGAVPVQFDFETWSSLMDQFIYQQTDFQFIRIISAYGSSKSMFRDFALDALTQGKKIGAVPGVPLSQTQKENLEVPIVWPVWSYGCFAQGESDKVKSVGTPCISYELAVPSDYMMEKLSGAVFGGRRMDLKVTNTISIGSNGHLLQLDTEVQGKVRQLGSGNGGLTLSYEDKQVTVNTDGAIALISVEQGDVINFGNVGGKFVMEVKAGRYESRGGSLNAIDQGVLIARDSIGEYPLQTSDGKIVATAKNTLACKSGGDDCVLYRQSMGDVERVATQGAIQGDSVILSGGDIKEQTLHESRIVHEFDGNTQVVRTSFQTLRSHELLTGRVVRRANGTYTGRGIALFADKGGVVAGRTGTDVRAITSQGEYYSKTIKYHTLNKQSETVEALATHTSLVEVGTGSPDAPLTIGDADSSTVIEGLVMIGGETGPGLIIRGGKGSALLEHLIPSSMRVTVKRSGIIKGRMPKFAMKDANIMRNIESLKYHDGLGFATGMITDLVSAYRTLNFVRDVQLLKDLSIATGTAFLAALFGNCARAGVSFGREITIISSDGVSSVPNQIGKDRSLGDAESGVFGIYINSDYTMEHMKVNVKKIDGVILGKLNLKPGTNRLIRTTEYRSEALSFELSLGGLSVMSDVSNMNQEHYQSRPEQNSFFGQEVLLVVNDQLEIEGTIIDGQQVKVETPELLVQNVLEKIKTETSFSSVGVGVALGWEGPIPTFNAGGGSDLKNSSLVKFVSGITGDSVEIVAESITADLNQVSARTKLLTNATRALNPANPSPSGVSHRAWSAQAGLSLNTDGSVSPSLFASHTRDDVRTSVHISPDLVTGLQAIASWPSKAFKPSSADSFDTKTAEPESKKFAKKYQARKARDHNEHNNPDSEYKQRIAKAVEDLRTASSELQDEYDTLQPDKKKIVDEFQKSNEAILHKAREDAAFAKSNLGDGEGDAGHLGETTAIAESVRELEAKHAEFERQHPELAIFFELALNVNMRILTSYAPYFFDSLHETLASPGMTPSSTPSSNDAAVQDAHNKLQNHLLEHDLAIDKDDAKTLASVAMKKNALDGLYNSNSAYENSADKARGKLSEVPHSSVYHFDDPLTGARATVVEKVNADGTKVPVYNTAGVHPLDGTWQSRKELIKDAPSAVTVGISGSTLGNALSKLPEFFRRYGELLDNVGDRTFTEDPNYEGKSMHWDQIPDQAYQHISNLEKYNKVTGNTEPLPLNGHSMGGPLNVAIKILRPHLVSEASVYDSPGFANMVKHMLNGNTEAIANLYKDIKIYAAPPGGNINSLGMYPNGLKVGMILSREHGVDALIAAVKTHGVIEVSSNLYNAGGTYNHDTGEYLLARPLPTTTAMLANELQMPIEQIVQLPPASGIGAFEEMTACFIIKLANPTKQ